MLEYVKCSPTGLRPGLVEGCCFMTDSSSPVSWHLQSGQIQKKRIVIVRDAPNGK